MPVDLPETISRIPDYPGMAQQSDGLGYFEQAYDAGNGLVARIRFKPVQVDQPVTTESASGPVVPFALAVQCSASIVDPDGQVVKIAGRYLVRDPKTHTWQFDNGDDLDPSAWQDDMAKDAVDDLLKARAAMMAAEMFMVPVPEPVPGDLPPDET